MPSKGSIEKDKLLERVKRDIVSTDSPEHTYELLDDGTVIVHIWVPTMLRPLQTNRINISIGREMKPEEWKANVKET